MPLHPRTCSILYSISCLLDALDGLAARRFEQSTKFGAVLDMVTDRCTTACLLVFLASAFPRWSIIFQGLISLDLASHYMHMYATLSMGGAGQSHKKVEASRSWVLKMYYSNNVRLSAPSTSGSEFDPRDNGLLTNCTESPLHLLRPQRGLLHRALPPLVLLALPFPNPLEELRLTLLAASGHSSRTEALDDLHEPVVGRCYGDGQVSTQSLLPTHSR